MQRSNQVVLMLSGSVLLSGVVSGALAVGWDALNTLRSGSANMQMALPDMTPAFGSHGVEPEEEVPDLASAIPANFTPVSKPDRFAPRFTIVPLDTQLGGRAFYPVALNNQGDVLGGVLTDEAHGQQRFRLDAYLFRNDTLTQLAPLTGFKYSWPMALNNRGQVVCISYEPTSSAQSSSTQSAVMPVTSNVNVSKYNTFPSRRIVLWDKGTVRDLQIGDQFVARGMSRDVLDTLARVRVGLNDRGQLTLALDSLYWWGEGKLHLAGGRVPMAAPLLPLNNQGVLVRPSVRGLASGYDRWDRSATPVPSLSAEWYDVIHQREQALSASEVWDMNDKSEVLCSNTFVGQKSARQFFILGRHGTRRRIATMPTYAASFINNKGQVVGLSSRISPANAINSTSLPRSTPQKGPFWWQNDRLYDLNDLLPPESGWTILQVRDFNDRGEVLVYATDAQRKNHPLLLRPVSTLSTTK